MKLNTVENKLTKLTHEGAPAYAITPEQLLRRSVMSCMLWENEFYEDGQSVAKRIADTIPLVKPEIVSQIAIDARSKMKLRHVPLLIVREMARHPTHRPYVRATLATVIQRADELAEFLAIYWKDGKCKIAASVKKGLADAFVKFNAYNLAKYNRDGKIKLRDVLFLCHAKPENKEQAELWKLLIDNKLPIPDTWEVALSTGKDKKETWTRLISEKKLGALALLRNLRNMEQVAVEPSLISQALQEMNPEKVLPFRFLAALRYAPRYVSELDQAMLRSLKTTEFKLKGNTVVLVDVSGSMDVAMSAKSDMWRVDAAAGLAIFARELCERCIILTFSDKCIEVPSYHGLALVEAIKNSQVHSGTYLGKTIQGVNANLKYDRIICISDEQSHDKVPGPNGKGYMINVASNKNGVGYGPWVHIDGFSERILDYIYELES